MHWLQWKKRWDMNMSESRVSELDKKKKHQGSIEVEKERRIQQGLLKNKSREHALHVLLLSGGSMNT